jgi:hypothetical protein
VEKQRQGEPEELSEDNSPRGTSYTVLEAITSYKSSERHSNK